ncbi:hypothetical protein H4R18_003622 [Coemansia javaensis]|uniref:Transmembrane protein 135 N-terminal domain-containing protein n=1 Tax=Coemansia javaensis TaxID=2761396 RepID=A0A9W8H848_9FUNG|nr:hypothetical protein H4R18_003622 [Coemansia javaensis]
MESTAASHLLNSVVEVVARITSHALTDKEKESVVEGFRSFNKRLERIGSRNSLRQLAIESQKWRRRRQTPRCQHEDTSCVQNSIRGFIKAFLVGFGVKAGLSAASQLLSLRAFTRPRLLLSGFSRDTLGFAAFLSTLIGSYKAFLCAARHIRGSRSSEYTNALVAGMLAGLVSAKLDRNRSRRTAIALYLCTRAMQYGCIWLFERYVAQQQTEDDMIRRRLMQRAHSINTIIPVGPRRGRVTEAPPSPDCSAKTMPRPTRGIGALGGPGVEAAGGDSGGSSGGFAQWAIEFTRKYASSALMVVSNVGLIYPLVFHTESLSRGFANLLMVGSGYDSLNPRRELNGFKAIGCHVVGERAGRGIPAGMPTKAFFSQIPFAHKVADALDSTIHHDHVACGVLHPHTTSCTLGVAGTFLRGLPYAMRLHIPFNIAMLLLFQSQRLLKNPVGTLRSLVKSTVQSSVYFTLMIVGITNSTCLFRKAIGRDAVGNYILSGIVGGLAILVERPGRRGELSMYCFLRALEAAWDIGVKTGLWWNVRHGEVALFAASMGVLMSIFQNDPTTLSLTYHSTLTRIFGEN